MTGTEVTGTGLPPGPVGSGAVAEAELRIACVVTTRRTVAEGVVSLALRAADGAPLPSWSPGAHIDLVMQDGALVRQYSLCGDPADTGEWRIAVLREVEGRGGSAAVHDELHEGASVVVQGPRNHFALVDAPEYLFIAGGIGITPILPMLTRAQARGARWRLVYGGRTRSSMAFTDELVAHGDRVVLVPQDEHGLIDLAGELAATPGAQVYCCGPGPLLDALHEIGRPAFDGRLHVERFAPVEVADQPGDRPIEVVLERSGITLTVAAGQTILDACHAAGVDIPCSCTQGICGTCETEVLEGVPDHRDAVLSDAEREAGGLMMVCVSRALTDSLVLDL